MDPPDAGALEALPQPAVAVAGKFVPCPPQGRPSQAGRKKVRPQSAVVASKEAAAPSHAAGLSRSFGARGSPSLGDEYNFDWFDGADAGTIQTPKNSDRVGGGEDGL